MRQATLVWTLWQALLQPFAWAFTRPGYRRFVEWVTALARHSRAHARELDGGGPHGGPPR